MLHVTCSHSDMTSLWVRLVSLFSAVRHVLHKRFAAVFLIFLIKPKTYTTLVRSESLVVRHGTMSLLLLFSSWSVNEEDTQEREGVALVLC